jgi:hypothetical protein
MKTLRVARSACAFVCVAAFNACAAGGGALTPASSPAAPATAAQAKHLHKARVSISIKIPPRRHVRHGRGAHYLTPAVEGVLFTVTQPSNVYQGTNFFALSASEPYCSGGTGSNPLVCTLSISAPVGHDTITATTYDGPNSGSRVVSTGSVVQDIVLHTLNTIAIATSGVVVGLQAAAVNLYPAVGQSATIPILVTALDADNYAIVGPFDQPLAVSDSDTSGATTLSQTTVASAADAANLSVTYNGAALANALIVVTTNSPQDPNNGGPFSSTVILEPGLNYVTASPGLLSFAHANSSAQNVTIAGDTAPYSVTTDGDVSGDPDCSALATVTGSGVSFTVTPTPGTSGGLCWLNVQSNNTSGSIPVAISP